MLSLPRSIKLLVSEEKSYQKAVEYLTDRYKISFLVLKKSPQEYKQEDPEELVMIYCDIKSSQDILKFNLMLEEHAYHIKNKLGVVTIPFKLYGSKYPGKHLVILDYTFEKIYIGDHKLYSIDQKTEHHLAKFSAKIKKKGSSDELKEAAENDKPDFILLEDLQVKFVSGLLKSTFYKDDHYQAYKLREFNFRNIEFCKHIVIIKADYGMIDNEKSAQIQQLQEFLSKENLLVIIATMTKDSFSDSKFPENIVFLTYEPEMDENDILQKYMIHGESYENLKGILERFIYKKRNISISTKESINA